jgi:hypothetical protein
VREGCVEETISAAAAAEMAAGARRLSGARQASVGRLSVLQLRKILSSPREPQEWGPVDGADKTQVGI